MSWGRLFQISVCVRFENTEEGLYESILFISLLEKTKEGLYESVLFISLLEETK